MRSGIFIIGFAFVVVGAFTMFTPRASATVVLINTSTSTSNNASTSLAKVGDTVSFRVTFDGTPTATNTPQINIFQMGSTTMSGSGSTWTYSTTAPATAWSEGNVTYRLSWGGTAGEATSTFISTATTSPLAHVRYDKTAPTMPVTSNASAAGVLKVGDTIVFTGTPTATELGGSVAGTYNGQTLTWSTSDSGVTFTATYTVVEGESDQTTAIQLSDLIPTDAAGNASSTAGATTDVAKTIDANTPTTPTASPSAGTYSGGTEVSLSASNHDTIRYTLDDIAPTCSTGSLFSSAFTVSSAVVRAIACDSAGNGPSAVASFTYSRTSSSGNSSGGGGGGGGSAATVASAGRISSGQKTAILDLLKSFGADEAVLRSVNAALNGEPAALGTPAAQNNNAPAFSNSVFTRDLETGANGDDVRALQAWLNANGYPVSVSGPGSVGNETTLFGSMTRAALIKFQQAMGITPAVGYFGPKTRAALGM